uniref:Uncharacterized protein n=1 Tax=Rhizophora mucronata TaxID=61149 RepID=A0A2P2KWH6_RHIMU
MLLRAKISSKRAEIWERAYKEKQRKGVELKEAKYHGQFAIGRAYIREGGVLANPENRIIARTAVRFSFPVVHL